MNLLLTAATPAGVTSRGHLLQRGAEKVTVEERSVPRIATEENQVAEIVVTAERTLDLPSSETYGYIIDYTTHHGAWLPPAYSEYRVTAGGVGAGTAFSYHLNTGRRERDYHMQVTEPVPGRTIQEADNGSSLTNTWTVEPRGEGSVVRIETRWQGAGGVGGFFERTFAPRAVQALHTDTLARLAAYARDQHGAE